MSNLKETPSIAKIQGESVKEKTLEQEKEESDYIVKKINELNKELFGDEEILNPERIIRRIQYAKSKIENGDKNLIENWIINEAIGREMELTIKDLELKKEGISGVNATFGERKDIRAKQREGKAIEPKIDIKEADQKIAKLEKKLIEISQKIEE